MKPNLNMGSFNYPAMIALLQPRGNMTNAMSVLLAYDCCHIQ